MNRAKLTGKVFGRLTVISFAHLNHSQHSYWNCKCSCGKDVIVAAKHLGATISCGCYRKAINAKIHWKGGKYRTQQGYVAIHVGTNGRKAVYRTEHRIVMEKLLGRPLRDNEQVHHKNGIRSDNDPGNLELWVRSHPYGQRVNDLVAWAKEILTLYEQESQRLDSTIQCAPLTARYEKAQAAKSFFDQFE